MNKKQELIAAELLTMINEFLTNITKTLNPKKFIGEEALFIKMAIAPACMVAGTIIDKICTTFEISTEVMIEDFAINLRDAIAQSKLMHQQKDH